MTDLYRPSRKRVPRLVRKQLRKGDPYQWCCYGYGCWGFGETLTDAYWTWAADYQAWGHQLAVLRQP